MSTAANKAALRRYLEDVWNAGDAALLGELCAPDFVQHFRGEARAISLEEHKALLDCWRRAFPDLHIAIDDLLADGDKVVARLSWEGTHSGPLFDRVPASGRRVRWTQTFIGRFAGGKLVEGWQEYDLLGLLEQVAVPAPALGR